MSRQPDTALRQLRSQHSAVNAPKGRFPPIGVNLSPQRVPNLRFSFSPGMGEAAVHIGIGAQQVIDREATDDRTSSKARRPIFHTRHSEGI